MAGNTSVSGLLSAANAAYQRNQAYKDQIASFEYDLSPKDEESFRRYQTYLDSRVAKTRNDPSKQLTLQRTAVSAARTFRSAEVSRATTAVKYGDIDNRSKYQKLVELWHQASADGDLSNAQAIESQLASLSVTIQNEDMAAANSAEAAGKKAMATNKRGLDQSVRDYDEIVKLAQAKVRNGSMSVQDYQKGVAQALTGKRDLLQQAANGGVPGISEDAISSYADRLLTLEASPEFNKALSLAGQANSGNPSQYLSIDPARQLPDGSAYGELKDRPLGKPVVGADGNIVTSYVGGFGDNGDSKTGREDFAKKGSEYVLPVVGNNDPSKNASYVGSKLVSDDKGNYFAVDQNGNKHFVTTDPNSILQRSQEAIDPSLYKDRLVENTVSEFAKGVGNSASQFGRQFGGLPGTVAPGLNAIGAGTSLIGRLVGGDQLARQKAAQVAAAKKAEEEAIARARILTAPKPAPLPAFKAVLPPAYAPKSVAPVQNLLNAVPAKGTAAQKTLAGVSNLIDVGVAANKKAPAAPASKPWWKFW